MWLTFAEAKIVKSTSNDAAYDGVLNLRDVQELESSKSLHGSADGALNSLR